MMWPMTIVEDFLFRSWPYKSLLKSRNACFDGESGYLGTYSASNFFYRSQSELAEMLCGPPSKSGGRSFERTARFSDGPN